MAARFVASHHLMATSSSDTDNRNVNAAWNNTIRRIINASSLENVKPLIFYCFATRRPEKKWFFFRGLCSHAVSVRLESVTFVYCVKTGKCILKLVSSSGINIILVFPYRNLRQYSNGDLPTGASSAGGVWKIAIWPISRFISKMMQDMATVTMECE